MMGAKRGDDSATRIKPVSDDTKALKFMREIVAGISMADETIEVCAKCGKMPRTIDFDLSTGGFRCSRCGGAELRMLTSSEYEVVVSELEDKFTREALRAAAPSPMRTVELPQIRSQTSASAMPSGRPEPRPAAPARKSAHVKKTAKPKAKAAKKRKTAKKARKR